ncbi:MAG: GNAT family N-acetyltransferase [Bacteroidales bacterium]|nr:GNAT family N-acetyltransferase [Bacteroidales bacterium]
MFTVEICHLTITEINNYLIKNDLIFVPSLSTRFDINNFAIKLNKYAIHFCAHQEEKLIGFSGCYFNNIKIRTGFISNFSVIKEFQGMGVAKNLLSSIIEYGSRNGFIQIKLQVYISNLPAIQFYTKYGFIEISRNKDLSEMVLYL